MDGLDRGQCGGRFAREYAGANLDIYSLVTDGVEPGGQEDPGVAAWNQAIELCSV
jgi:hypothetical protein